MAFNGDKVRDGRVLDPELAKASDLLDRAANELSGISDSINRLKEARVDEVKQLRSSLNRCEIVLDRLLAQVQSGKVSAGDGDKLKRLYKAAYDDRNAILESLENIQRTKSVEKFDAIMKDVPAVIKEPKTLHDYVVNLLCKRMLVEVSNSIVSIQEGGYTGLSKEQRAVLDAHVRKIDLLFSQLPSVGDSFRDSQQWIFSLPIRMLQHYVQNKSALEVDARTHSDLLVLENRLAMNGFTIRNAVSAREKAPIPISKIRDVFVSMPIELREKVFEYACDVSDSGIVIPDKPDDGVNAQPGLYKKLEGSVAIERLWNMCRVFQNETPVAWPELPNSAFPVGTVPDTHFLQRVFEKGYAVYTEARERVSARLSDSAQRLHPGERSRAVIDEIETLYSSRVLGRTS